MLTTIFIELRKLKGTLVALLCLVAPTVVAVVVAVLCARQPLMSWKDAVRGGIGLWGYFMLPMTVTALSALLAHLEHGTRMWDHLLALPLKRWRLFAAKGVVVMLLIALMSFLLVVEVRLVGLIVELLLPAKLPVGDFPWQMAAENLLAMWAASLLVCMIQLWVALHFKSFIAPLLLGLTGTFVAVISVGAKESVFVPWVTPIATLARDGAQMDIALQLGVGGGMLVMLAMVWHLSQKEA
jgi:lantibiotic transport system permease protein